MKIEIDRERFIGAFKLCVEKMIERNHYLLLRALKEECVNAAFMLILIEFMPEFFPELKGLNFDVEYDKLLHEDKQIDGASIRPDIIIHERGTTCNFAYIETKLKSIDAWALGKVDAVIDEPFKYGYAVFLNFGRDGAFSEFWLLTEGVPYKPNGGIKIPHINFEKRRLELLKEEGLL